MHRVERYLHFDKINMEQPDISSRSGWCGQTFCAEPKPGERVDDLLARIRPEFSAHVCESQTFAGFKK